MNALIVLKILTLLFYGINGDPDWWKTMSLYQIYPRSYKDSNGDGIGDLKGIDSKLQHLVDSKYDALWLSPIYPSPMKDFGYDISNFRGIDPVYGTMKDFENLLQKAHSSSLKVIIDFVPNHSSDKHEWFQKSVKKIEPYTDYYIWHEGKVVNGTRHPPNNWVSVFYGSAWTWNEDRQAYYFHQFLSEQPDLNYRNKLVVEEMKNVMRFWLNKGVDGFRVDAVPHLFEYKELYDEPMTGLTNDSNSFVYLEHIYTTNLLETYEMVRQWQNVIDEYKTKNDSRVMMLEVYANTKQTIDYYFYGANFPFNFRLIFAGRNASAEELKDMVEDWMVHLPIGATSNWVVGNHDNPRLASRVGPEYALVLQAMAQLLPGVGVTYNGEEIGMEDTELSWEETRDPQACRVGDKLYDKSSRDPARTPFQWDATVSAGFSNNSKTWLRVNDNYKQLNLAAQKGSDKSYYKSFLKLTSLRKWPAVKKGTIQTRLLSPTVFAFSRELRGEKPVYVVINTGYEPQNVNLQIFETAPPKLLLYTTLPAAQDIKEGETFNADNFRIGARSCYIFVAID